MDETNKRRRSLFRTVTNPAEVKETRGGRTLTLLCACGYKQTFRGANAQAVDLAVRRAGWKNNQCPTCLAKKENAP